MAKQYKIHPAIGIARVGNSRQIFIGPEIPGKPATPPDGKYRDGDKKLRRQAQRFRVYEYDDTQPNAAPKEILVSPTTNVARIEWTVHLTNKKAVWFDFDGNTGEGPTGYPPGHPLRNPTIVNPAERKKKLVIDPGPRTLNALSQQVEIAKGGGLDFPETWPGLLAGDKEITSLGTLQTDDKGRLIAAGGFGISGTMGALPADGQLNFDNNNGWFDDVSDGSVTARLVFKDGTTAAVSPAWLIVGPPDFAPPIENIVTMYDLLYDLSLRKLKLDPTIFDPLTNQFRTEFKPSFVEHIYPILQRAFNYRWVEATGAAAPVYHGSLQNFAALATPPPAGGPDPNLTVRRAVFNRLRNPNPGQPNNVPGNMPKLNGDNNGPLNFTVTITQFEMMRRWAAGQFHNQGWTGAPPAPAAEVTAKELDRAALDSMAGGAFYPGIESGWIMRDARIYAEPFRVRHATTETDPNGALPGDLTKRSALPWQADFLDCADNWWPAQRPNEVRANATATGVVEWARGIANHVDLVNRWHLLGVVVPATDPTAAAKYHESEREAP